MPDKKLINENDIRPKDLMKGQKKAMHEDIEWLNKKAKGFIKVTCPACQKDKSKFLYEKYYLNHVLCSVCGTQYVNPRPTKTILKDFYKNSVNYAYWAKYIFSASKDVRKEKIFKPRAKILQDSIRDKGLNGNMLEIGAAYGYFCDEAIKLNHFKQVYGIEPTPDLANVLRTKDIKVIESPYEYANIDFDIDVIVNFEVIEHLFSPIEFLKWCYKKLNPGGCLYLTCPNIGGFETTILGQESGTVDHEHLNLFNTNSIKNVVKNVGFENIIVKTPGVLDYDIVKQAFLSKKVKKNILGNFLLKIIKSNNKSLEEEFQKFLIKSNNSSHMMLLAFKPK